MLHRRVEELLHLGKGHDLVELARDLRALHPQDRAVQIDVLAAGELGMEAGADLQQRPNAAADLRAPLRRLRDPREDLEERRLAGAVAADDPHNLALLDLERNVLERPDMALLVAVAAAEEPKRRGGGPHQRLAQRGVRAPALPDPVALAQPFDSDGKIFHSLADTCSKKSAKASRSIRTWPNTEPKPSTKAFTRAGSSTKL